MRESFGHAGANQQNYLDLGYSDRKAQTRAGLIAGAELSLPRAVKGMKASRFLAKGMMQASRLANRWGLFGRNLSREPLNFYEAKNHINGLQLQRYYW